MCTVSKMTYIVLCIFGVAVISQLSRLGELRYVPALVKSLITSSPPAEAASHLINSTTALTTSGATTPPSALPANQSTDSTQLRMLFVGLYISKFASVRLLRGQKFDVCSSCNNADVCFGNNPDYVIPEQYVVKWDDNVVIEIEL